MHHLPREIQLQILNYLVYFYDSSSVTKEDIFFKRTFMKYSYNTSLEKEYAIENIQILCRLSQVNRQWYELITHQRMNRLWKCAYLQMNGTVTDINKMKKTDTETLTQVVYKHCKDLYLDALFLVKLTIFIEACKMVNTKACIRVLSTINLSRNDNKERVMNEFYSNSYNDKLNWTVFDYILATNEELLTFGHFLKYMTSMYGYTDEYCKIINVIKRLKIENQEKIFTPCDDVCVIMSLELPMDNFNLITPFIRKYYSYGYIDYSTQYERVIQKLLANENSKDVLTKVKFVRECIGEEKFKVISTKVVQTLSLQCVNSLVDINKFIDVITYLVAIPVDYKQHTVTLLHSFCQLAVPVTNINLFVTMLTKFKHYFAPMTIITNSEGKLPIEDFLSSFTNVRTCNRYINRMNEVQRLHIIDLMFSICPDIKIYKRNKIGAHITTMISNTGDDKKKYAKYLSMV
jgi:hypothetical protein